MRRHFAIVNAQAAALGWRLSAWIAACRARSAGQGLVEYGLLLIMIMIVCLGILTLTGVTLSDIWYTRALSRMP